MSKREYMCVLDLYGATSGEAAPDKTMQSRQGKHLNNNASSPWPTVDDDIKCHVAASVWWPETALGKRTAAAGDDVLMSKLIKCFQCNTECELLVQCGDANS